MMLLGIFRSWYKSVLISGSAYYSFLANVVSIYFKFKTKNGFNLLTLNRDRFQDD